MVAELGLPIRWQVSMEMSEVQATLLSEPTFYCLRTLSRQTTRSINLIPL